jgi:hypothetical protein
MPCLRIMYIMLNCRIGGSDVVASPVGTVAPQSCWHPVNIPEPSLTRKISSLADPFASIRSLVVLTANSVSLEPPTFNPD